jgi:hypothetical protein
MISHRHRRLAAPPARESALVSNTPNPGWRLSRPIAIGAAALASLGTAVLATSPASTASQGETR